MRICAKGIAGHVDATPPVDHWQASCGIDFAATMTWQAFNAESEKSAQSIPNTHFIYSYSEGRDSRPLIKLPVAQLLPSS